MTTTLYLPGAGGRRAFWAPVAQAVGGPHRLSGWPGFGDVPPDPSIEKLSDLTSYVMGGVEEPVNLVAQSMGGVVAMLAALRYPDRVRAMVLCGTSGGVDMSAFEADEWRLDYLEEMPETTPHWFVDDRTDLSAEIPSITCPVLLLWGGDDRLSPVAMALRLSELLPDARLVTVAGAGHALATEKPLEVARLIESFLLDGSG